MSVAEALGEIFSECWHVWTIDFYVGDGFSFCLADVAAVAVFVWVVSLAIGTLLNDDWGA